MKCDKCNQEIPEAVWVGPGDEVLFTGKQFKVVGESRRFENMIIVEGFGPYCDPFARAYPDELRTLDGRRVAEFRYPAQETIMEYDAANKHLASDLADARERIAELEAKLSEQRDAMITYRSDLDERNVRIAELEDIRDDYTAHHDHLYAKIALLERQLKAMEITDEDTDKFVMGYSRDVKECMLDALFFLKLRINERRKAVK